MDGRGHFVLVPVSCTVKWKITFFLSSEISYMHALKFNTFMKSSSFIVIWMLWKRIILEKLEEHPKIHWFTDSSISLETWFHVMETMCTWIINTNSQNLQKLLHEVWICWTIHDLIPGSIKPFCAVFHLVETLTHRQVQTLQ